MARFRKGFTALTVFFLCILVLCFACLLPSGAADNGFSLSVGAVEDGGIVRLRVYAEKNRNFGGFSLLLHYDDTLLRYDSSSVSDCGGIALAEPTGNGSVAIAFVTVAEDILTNDEPICEIVFQIAEGAVGTAEISLEVLEAIDANYNPIGGLTADPVYIDISQSSLTLESEPMQKFYFCGDTLNTEGLRVVATYFGGAQEVLSEYAISGFQSDVPGTTTVTVRSGKNRVYFSVVIVVKGDVDADNNVNSDDYELIAAQSAVRAELSDEMHFRMDVNGDGAVDGFDAAYEDLLLQGVV